MKLVSSRRRRCAVCKTRLIRVDGSLVCPDWTCAQSPAATLNSVRTMPPVAPGYVPATHVLPAVLEPRSRPPEPPRTDATPSTSPAASYGELPPCSPDVPASLLLR